LVLQVNFEPDARQQYLKLLGYSPSLIKEQMNEALQKGTELKCDKVEADTDIFDDRVSILGLMWNVVTQTFINYGHLT
jgi:hypothetical protein